MTHPTFEQYIEMFQTSADAFEAAVDLAEEEGETEVALSLKDVANEISHIVKHFKNAKAALTKDAATFLVYIMIKETAKALRENL